MAPAAVPGFNLLRHDTSSLLQCAASHLPARSGLGLAVGADQMSPYPPGCILRCGRTAHSLRAMPCRFGQPVLVARGVAPLDHRFMPKTTFRGYLITLPCAAR